MLCFGPIEHCDIYTRDELEAFIGYDNLDDFDVDAIEQDVSEWDSSIGCRFWSVEGDELARVCARHQKVTAPDLFLDIDTQRYDNFDGMRRFGFVRDAVGCMPGDFVILYKLRDGSFGVWDKCIDLLTVLRRMNVLDGTCSRNGEPIEFTVWHVVS